ncbi:MAG: hypothetical protein KDH88_15615 [Chromatiales bacterium]|nr:hypothetical protein [Chromatiales bacterium]
MAEPLWSTVRPGGLVDHPLGEALDDAALSRLMRERALADAGSACFLGAGVASHFALRSLPGAGNGAVGLEAGLASLFGFAELRIGFPDVVEALARVLLRLSEEYDGRQAVLLPMSVNPRLRTALKNIMVASAVRFVDVGFDIRSGRLGVSELERAAAGVSPLALILPQPNFFGVVEDAAPLAEWAHGKGLKVIALSDPLSASVLTEPGAWGADFAVGDARVLGLDSASGGPALAWIAGERVAEVPLDSGEAWQTADAWLRWRGYSGLRELAEQCHQRATEFMLRITRRFDVGRRFDAPFLHEFTLDMMAAPPRECLRAMAAHNVLGGLDLSEDYPELVSGLLVCVTERHSEADFADFEERLDRIIGMRS